MYATNILIIHEIMRMVSHKGAKDTKYTKVFIGLELFIKSIGD